MLLPDPVAFTLFGIDIYWYGIIIAAAVVVGIWVAMREAGRIDYNQESVLDICLIVIPAAIVGARFYYVVFQWDIFKGNFWSIFNPRTGGLAIYGAIIAAIIVIWVYSRVKKVSFLQILDIFAPAVVLGQAIGRWGNFFNQEAYGFAIHNPKWQWFPFAVPIQNGMIDWHLATFFYESLWCVIVFLFIWFFVRKRAKRRGTIVLSYFALYGFERAFVEILRTDSLTIAPIPGGLSYFELLARGEATLAQLPVSTLLSLVVAAASVVILIVRSRRPIEPDTALDESILDMPSSGERNLFLEPEGLLEEDVPASPPSIAEFYEARLAERQEADEDSFQ
ncbi:MAG: prolipoprotein diacylglyceryl transferase [Christensenellales bacterium]|jgi:phosphatidylglycerol:prolipoprotein diacylglycerol transferase